MNILIPGYALNHPILSDIVAHYDIPRMPPNLDLDISTQVDLDPDIEDITRATLSLRL